MPRGGARPGAGRPRKPPPNRPRTLRKLVCIAAGSGMPHEEIAAGVGVDLATLQERYRVELSTGAHRCRLEVLAAMYACALAGSVPAMNAFLRKSPRFALAPVLGKKAAADALAPTAQAGTEWAALLPLNPTKQ